MLLRSSPLVLVFYIADLCRIALLYGSKWFHRLKWFLSVLRVVFRQVNFLSPVVVHFSFVTRFSFPCSFVSSPRVTVGFRWVATTILSVSSDMIPMFSRSSSVLTNHDGNIAPCAISTFFSRNLDSSDTLKMKTQEPDVHCFQSRRFFLIQPKAPKS